MRRISVQSKDNAVMDVPYNIFCVISVAISGAAFVLNHFMWYFPSIVGIALAIAGIVIVSKTKEKGINLSWIGLVLGVVSIVYTIILKSVVIPDIISTVSNLINSISILR